MPKCCFHHHHEWPPTRSPSLATLSQNSNSQEKVFDEISFHYGPVLQGKEKHMAPLVKWIIWSYFSIKTTKKINTLEGGEYASYPSLQDNHRLQKHVAISSYIWLSARQLLLLVGLVHVSEGLLAAGWSSLILAGKTRTSGSAPPVGMFSWVMTETQEGQTLSHKCFLSPSLYHIC